MDSFATNAATACIPLVTAQVLAQAAPALNDTTVNYLLQGGSTAAVLVTLGIMLWYQDKERRAERRHREQIANQFTASARVTNICLLENAEQNARVSMMLEALAPFAKKNVNPSSSQVLNMKQIQETREQLVKEHEQYLAKEGKDLMLGSEESQEK